MLDRWRSTELQWRDTLGNLHPHTVIVCQCKAEPGAGLGTNVGQVLAQSALEQLHRELESLLVSSVMHVCRHTGLYDSLLT